MEPLGAVPLTIRVGDVNLPTVLDQLARLGNGNGRTEANRRGRHHRDMGVFVGGVL